MKPTRSGEPWTVKDDFALMMLVGKQSYAQIAQRLGRTPGAVQRRASYKGYSADMEKRSAVTQRVRAKSKNLLATAEELAEFLPSLD